MEGNIECWEVKLPILKLPLPCRDIAIIKGTGCLSEQSCLWNGNFSVSSGAEGWILSENLHSLAEQGLLSRQHINLPLPSSQIEVSSPPQRFHHLACLFCTGINEIVTCQAAACQRQRQVMEMSSCSICAGEPTEKPRDHCLFYLVAVQWLILSMQKLF